MKRSRYRRSKSRQRSRRRRRSRKRSRSRSRSRSRKLSRSRSRSRKLSRSRSRSRKLSRSRSRSRILSRRYRYSKLRGGTFADDRAVAENKRNAQRLQHAKMLATQHKNLDHVNRNATVNQSIINKAKSGKQLTSAQSQRLNQLKDKYGGVSNVVAVQEKSSCPGCSMMFRGY